LIQSSHERRDALVTAAYRLIASDGFEHLRTRTVADDVGVNVATLHYYFPTKESLIRAVAGYAMRRFISMLPTQGSPLEQLRTHLRGIARLLESDQQLWAAMAEIVLRAPRDPDLATVLRQMDEYWHRSLRGLIAGCIAEGTIAESVDPDAVAALMIVALKGLSLPSITGFDPQRLEQVYQQFERLVGVPISQL
jgi:AcrR family transcriptional regulator